MRMLRQPQRGLLFEDVFPVPVHHAGAKHMLAAAGGNQRAQLLFGLLLGKPMQIEEQLRQIISTARSFSARNGLTSGRTYFVEPSVFSSG